MASDYEAIRVENRRRYGTDVGRYGKSVWADLYNERTHFIYELLQNAEDALRRHPDKPRSRTVQFNLSKQALRVSHYGKPFDRRDVEGVCGIALGTKQEDVTQIGRFGIGFKSVYGFTDRPEIHSGDEDFGIDSLVWPSAQSAVDRDPDQTVFIMPLRDPDEDRREIAEGFRRISLDTLLFLRHIDSIEWTLPDGESGTSVRQTDDWDREVRRVTVIGESTRHGEVEKSWLVFSRPTYAADDTLAGHVEVAFLFDGERVEPVVDSLLVVFFPTAVPTNLGFLIQGPYRTTQSRDNVPKTDEWNSLCVKKTVELLVDALVWLRDNDMLNVNVLQCLPLDRSKFDDGRMFASLYRGIKDALHTKNLLPAFDGGYVPAAKAKLARTQELRELFDRKQLKLLFRNEHETAWLTDDISQDRTPALRTYLVEDLHVDEVTPQTILPKLSTSFFEHQSNGWMCRLYEFLKGQVALHQQAKRIPIIRLSNGSHVPAFVDDIPQAFLPSAVKTGFPTIHADVCQSANARQFLGMIGLSKPHLVDDVIRHVLPKYDGDDREVSAAEYAEDIGRILEASESKASDKREELMQRLSETRFVRAANGDGAICFASPSGLTWPTERLKVLFAGIPGIVMVDERCDALRSDSIRSLLEECGTVRYLRPVRKEYDRWHIPLRKEFLADLRKRSGYPETTGRTDTVTDWMLHGLDDVLDKLRSLGAEDHSVRAKYIWEELIQLAERRGKAVFRGEYRWTHRGNHRQEFDAAFVRQLKQSAWIPDSNGSLQRPDLLLFESLNWRDDPFLLSKIRFKPPIVDQLATEAGFEPAMLDMLKELGITNVAALEKLGLLDAQPHGSGDVNSVADAVGASGVAATESPVVEYPSVEQSRTTEGGSAPPAPLGGYDDTPEKTGYRSEGSGGHPQQTRPTKASSVSVSFISYVAVDHKDSDDDGQRDHQERMKLEEDAIALILTDEQDWRPTRTHNPGFDLFKVVNGQECTWCEVKAMKVGLNDRPVGLSHTQFKYAQERGDAYWLYVVEHAGSEDARIVRIQDPAGKAKTFTFDKGWLAVAEHD